MSKIVVSGEFGHGKTCLVERFMTNKFYDKYPSTIGASFRTIIHNDAKLNIWDTAGQERFNSMLPMYYKDCDINLFCWAVNIDFDQERVEKLIKQMNNDSNIFFIITKIDLAFDNRISNISIMENWCISNNIPIYYTSSKNNDGINDLFFNITEKVKTLDKKKSDRVTLRSQRYHYSCLI